ncbi:MAG: MaoC/PaaZ C-terminal domain-containing protein [Spirochaetota bacterium]|nr:MaoC/PaaZ C-terminal domain-containing protein [Spirochaetota bacterium]
MPLNEEVIGREYSSDDAVEITAHESIYYALAYNEDNDAYFDNRREGGIITPPMYAVNYTGGGMGQVLMDPDTGMNFGAMVHYSQEFEWFIPVKPGDKIKSSAKITHIDVREKGSILGCEISGVNQNGETVTKAKAEFFDRSAGSGKPDERVMDPEPGKILWTQDMKVRNGQTYIYAEPSGDHNIIHIDDNVAKQVGLPGIILQGLCTMAFAHKTVVDNLTGPERDPLKVRKLKVQFSRPVLPGQTITYQGYEIGDEDSGKKYGIIAQNNEGKHVLRSSYCIIK